MFLERPCCIAYESINLPGMKFLAAKTLEENAIFLKRGKSFIVILLDKKEGKQCAVAYELQMQNACHTQRYGLCRFPFIYVGKNMVTQI